MDWTYVTDECSSAMHTSVRSKGDGKRQGVDDWGGLGVGAARERGRRAIVLPLHTERLLAADCSI